MVYSLLFCNINKFFSNIKIIIIVLLLLNERIDTFKSVNNYIIKRSYNSINKKLSFKANLADKDISIFDYGKQVYGVATYDALLTINIKIV